MLLFLLLVETEEYLYEHQQQNPVECLHDIEGHNYLSNQKQLVTLQRDILYL